HRDGRDLLAADGDLHLLPEQTGGEDQQGLRPGGCRAAKARQDEVPLREHPGRRRRWRDDGSVARSRGGAPRRTGCGPRGAPGRAGGSAGEPARGTSAVTTMNGDAVVRVRGLRKSFGHLEVLKGIDMEV